jgi:ATP-dependent DNA ligase
MTAAGCSGFIPSLLTTMRKAIDPAIPGAVKAPLPKKLAPQLATLVSDMPSAGDWVYEIKLDGYRLMTRFEDGKARLITRGGHDWSPRMPRLVRELKTIGVRSGWLDGEIVILNDDVPDFNALQNALDQHNSAGVVYFLPRRLRPPGRSTSPPPFSRGTAPISSCSSWIGVPACTCQLAHV